jgi:hypothetical protein
MSARTARRGIRLEALGAPDTRGSRFANRIAGVHSPCFNDLAAVPRWLMLPADLQARVALAAALLRHKSVLDRELSGQKLAALADVTGEDLFDTVMTSSSEPGASAGALPRPEDLADEGWAILHRSLPLPFATRFPGCANDDEARVVAEKAFDLVQSL